MDDYQLLIDLHKHQERQGPGSDRTTEQALGLTGLDPHQPLKVADIGCGTGAASLLLAQRLNAQITAVDFLSDFLQVLGDRSEALGLQDRIMPLCASMEALPFEPETYDVIWAEGSIYNMGFSRGIKEWRPYLKTGGVMVLSEITWLTATRPAEIQEYWQGEYGEIALPSQKISLLEQAGYQLLGYFPLPPSCWLDHYYHHLENRFGDFLQGQNHSEAAQAIVAMETKEIALYKKYQAYYSYGMYVVKKLPSV